MMCCLFVSLPSSHGSNDTVKTPQRHAGIRRHKETCPYIDHSPITQPAKVNMNCDDRLLPCVT